MITEELEDQKVRATSASDRCDRCGAEAFVWVDGLHGEMFFCGHHFAKHEEAIKEYAIEIVDDRQFIA